MYTYTYIHSTIQVVNVVTNWTNYHKCGKIRWTEHLQFQPYEIFRGYTFTVHWPPLFIIYLQVKIHVKTFAVLSKTTKVQSSESSPFTLRILLIKKYHVPTKCVCLYEQATFRNRENFNTTRYLNYGVFRSFEDMEEISTVDSLKLIHTTNPQNKPSILNISSVLLPAKCDSINFKELIGVHYTVVHRMTVKCCYLTAVTAITTIAEQEVKSQRLAKLHVPHGISVITIIRCQW